MIESLTLPLLFVGVLVATLLAAMLNLLLASMLLLVYRRRVLRAMNRRTSQSSQIWPAAPLSAQIDATSFGVDAARAYAATRRSARSMLVAGAVFAMICSVATVAAYPVLQSAGRFLMVLWICSWPIVLALLISMPGRRRTRIFWIATPFLLWAIAACWWSTTAPTAHSCSRHWRRLGARCRPAHPTCTPRQVISVSIAWRRTKARSGLCCRAFAPPRQMAADPGANAELPRLDRCPGQRCTVWQSCCLWRRCA